VHSLHVCQMGARFWFATTCYGATLRRRATLVLVGTFEQSVSAGELICVIMQNFDKIDQVVSEISHFLISKMATVRHIRFTYFFNF